MDINKKYDDTSPKSIEAYGKRLVNHTFEEVLKWNKTQEVRDPLDFNLFGNKARKGGLGNLLEEEYFGYRANSSPEPDFPKAGVELKVTPYERKKNGELRAGERLVLGMISYEKPIEDDFYDSHAWQKCKLMLLIFYLRNKELINNLKYVISFVSLFTPPKEDLAIIEQDYKVLSEKIKSGKAHELSEGDTMYLGACTKGASAEKSTVEQFYNTEVKARKRAFCFKSSYMTFILNNYIISGSKDLDRDIKGKEVYEHIVDNIDALEEYTFEEIIKSRIGKYAGKSDKTLCELFNIPYNCGKSQWTTIAYRMLGIKSNQAEEFKKANIVVKTIRIEENGKMKESSPLPAMRFGELIKQEWEDSDLYEYISETKFFFVVFKREGQDYYLKGCKLWNMPYNDFETVKEGWKEIQEIVKNGVILTKKKTLKGVEVKNNFPSKSNNDIIHIRPHTAKRYYVFEDGSTLGEGTMAHSDELPDGRIMPKHSFWINNTYIVKQIQDLIKD